MSTTLPPNTPGMDRIVIYFENGHIRWMDADPGTTTPDDIDAVLRNPSDTTVWRFNAHDCTVHIAARKILVVELIRATPKEQP